MLRGFAKLKIFQKSEKNSEVGGWVKPKSIGEWVGGVWTIRVFLGFLEFF